MPKVTKHLSTVTVEYTPRTSTFTITKAEHDLIVAMQAHDLQMIKFIHSQYNNMHYYDAEQVVNAVIEAKAVNIEGSGNRDTVEVNDGEQQTDWSKVEKGTWIYVKDFEDEGWILQEFIEYNKDKDYPFVCLTDVDHYIFTWKYAELLKPM